MKTENSELNGGFLRDRTSTHPPIRSFPDNLAFSNKDRADGNDSSRTAALIQNFIDACRSPVAILDNQLSIQFVNRAWRQFASMTGASSDRPFIGRRYPEVGMGVASTSNRDAAIIEAGIRCLIQKSEVEFQTEYLCTAIPEPLWLRVHAAPFFLPGGDDSSMILVTHDDITKEKLAGELLVTDRKRMNQLLDSANILPWEADAANGAITYIGDQAEQMFGYPRESWFAPDFWISCLHPDDKQGAIKELARLAQSKGQHRHEYRMMAKGGRIVWINDIFTVECESGKPSTIRGYMIDVTERKLSEETLLLLSGRLITAQEDERKRIARELHDDLNQRMALMSIELEQMGQKLTNKTDGISERIRKLQGKALGISQEIHRMSYELHPSKLDHLGLILALKSFCSELSGRRRMRINFRHEGASSALSADITLCLFRVAQEALQNSAKHSGVSTVDITLKITQTDATLDVIDSGCGFEMKKGKVFEGLGFISMRERLRLVNGFLKIQSKPFQGTHVSVCVPLHVNKVSADVMAQRSRIF